jgi:hypothetical protein
MGTWNGWLILLSSHFRFQFFILQICHSFWPFRFAILPRHPPKGDRHEKKEERLPFLLSTFLIFLFQFAFNSLVSLCLRPLGALPPLRGRFKRLSGSKRRATTWRKRRHQRWRGEGERSCCGALIIAPHEPIHKVQLHTRRSSKHPTPKEEGYCRRCSGRGDFCFL